MKTNRRPTQEMYELAKRKLGSHDEIINWFFRPVMPDNPVTPQHLLNTNADFLIMEMLEKLPDK